MTRYITIVLIYPFWCINCVLCVSIHVSKTSSQFTIWFAILSFNPKNVLFYIVDYDILTRFVKIFMILMLYILSMNKKIEIASYITTMEVK